MLTPTTRHGLLALLLATLTGLTGTTAAQTSRPVEADPTEIIGGLAPARLSPRYLLMNGKGRAVTSEDFRERFQLVAFGFTGCPDVCPTTMLEMQQVMASLGERASQVQPIFITVDPERDTAQVLDAYTRNFDARILGLTGSPALVRRAADSFKIQFEKVQEPGASANVYTMDHTAGLFLLGPDGQLLAKFGYGVPVTEIVSRIEQWMKADGQ
ncbi:MAG: SCO family protein [Pseudomonadota bacterium]